MKRAAVLVALAVLAAAPAVEARGSRCHETAPVLVIGRRRCRAFGRWDVSPRVGALSSTASAELAWHRLLLPSRSFAPSVPVDARSTDVKIGLPHTDIATGRFALELGRIGPVRLGGALELGGNPGTAQPFAVQGQSWTLSEVSYLSMGLNAAVGFDAGPLFLRGEIFGGYQSLYLSASSRLGLPAGGPVTGPFRGPPSADASSSSSQGLYEGRFRLAPRVSVEVWTTDYLTVGVAGAADVIYRDDFMLGAFVRSYFDKRGKDEPRSR